MNVNMAFHEAAHAVVAEVLRPGVVREVSIEEGPADCLRGDVYALGRTSFNVPHGLTELEFAAVLAASAHGERLVSEPRHIGGDEDDLLLIPLPSREIEWAIAFCGQIVSGYEKAVRSVADLLLERQTIDGESVRAVL